MRILTLKFSDSFGITSSRIILEQETLASPSLFKPKKSLWSIFSISIMDLGKLSEIQSWPTGRCVHCCKSMDSEILCYCFLVIELYLKNHLV